MGFDRPDPGKRAERVALSTGQEYHYMRDEHGRDSWYRVGVGSTSPQSEPISTDELVRIFTAAIRGDRG